jgi:hypothetical protein
MSLEVCVIVLAFIVGLFAINRFDKNNLKNMRR